MADHDDTYLAYTLIATEPDGTVWPVTTDRYAHFDEAKAAADELQAEREAKGQTGYRYGVAGIRPIYDAPLGG